MNIVIGKYGKSCLFDESEWGIIGGDEAPKTLFLKLANTYPQHTFYMLGRSDIKKPVAQNKLSKFIKADNIETAEKLPPNIISIWWDKPKNVNYHDDTVQPVHEWCAEWFEKNNVKLDFGILFSGPMGSATIPNKIIGIRNDKEFCKPMEMLIKYGAPIVHTLNVTNVPHILLCEDPRYVPLQNRDTINVEKGVLSQHNEIVDTKRIISYDNQERVTHKIEYRYSKIETIFLMRHKKVDFRNMQKNNKMLMTINGGSLGYTSIRDKMIKEWILNPIPDCKIYGSWADEWYVNYPNNFFKIAIKDAEPTLWDTKYTLIAPMAVDNFVTQKFWKTIYYGIIPFFHPRYDTDKLLPVPNFLRCKTPADMFEKIERLEKNPDDYRALLNHMYNVLDDGLFDGSIVLNEINKGLRDFIGFDLNGEYK